MDTAAQIRCAAMRLIARHGFDGVSLQTIADEVGITKQTLLYYYSSKDKLRRVVLNQLLEHWRKTLPALLEAVTSGEQRFDALTGELVRFFRADPDRARILLRELLDNPEYMRAQLVENLRPWIVFVAEHVRREQKAGLLHEDVDPESYVTHVILLVTTTVANLEIFPRMLSPDDESTEQSEARYVRELFRMARAALFKPQKARPKRLAASMKE